MTEYYVLNDDENLERATNDADIYLSTANNMGRTHDDTWRKLFVIPVIRTPNDDAPTDNKSPINILQFNFLANDYDVLEWAKTAFYVEPPNPDPLARDPVSEMIYMALMPERNADKFYDKVVWQVCIEDICKWYSPNKKEQAEHFTTIENEEKHRVLDDYTPYYKDDCLSLLDVTSKFLPIQTLAGIDMETYIDTGSLNYT